MTEAVKKDKEAPLQTRLIETLIENGSMSRRDLVNKLNTPRTTIYDNLKKLRRVKLVENYYLRNGKRGRPVTIWRIAD